MNEQILTSSVQIDALEAWRGDEATIKQQEQLQKQIGPHLAKATQDPFDYFVAMKTGESFHFHSATYVLGDDWILLEDFFPDTNSMLMKRFGHGFSRGLQVRLSDILFAADAPDGS